MSTTSCPTIDGRHESASAGLAKAISVGAVWAWAIRAGCKRTENRTWRTSYRGPLFIHAAKSDAHDEAALRFIGRQLGAVPPRHLIDELRGCVVARCELVSCDRYLPLIDRDPWAFGPYCWRLEAIERVDPVPVRGMPGLFEFSPG